LRLTDWSSRMLESMCRMFMKGSPDKEWAAKTP